ncbi:MAG: hypothetical protein IPJ88_09205 [Myxococcales bacterium]|nr:MAG: hypothetical protein IPJ88_09205 [Myxococcales bacterium]
MKKNLSRNSVLCTGVFVLITQSSIATAQDQSLAAQDETVKKESQKQPAEDKPSTPSGDVKQTDAKQKEESSSKKLNDDSVDVDIDERNTDELLLDEVALAEASSLEAYKENEPSLQLYGFSDFTLNVPLYDSADSWSNVHDPYSSFALGNLNLYLDAKLAENWRSLSEIRFLLLPNGALDTSTLSPSGTANRQNTSVADYSETNRPLRWGGVEIERAWVEYTAHPMATLRAGIWLTPYGIWNVDHGSPTVITINRPYIIGEQLFPERQTGLQLLGSSSMGHTTVGYHLTVSNGRGPVDSYQDLDNNKALGGRLYLRGQWLGDLQLGLSGYWGEYTDRGAVLSTIDAAVRRPLNEQFTEFSMAADARWTLGPWLFQAEAVVNELSYKNGKRPEVYPGAYASNRRAWGSYLITMYELPWFGIRPYVSGELYNSGTKISERTVILIAGLNIRPIPNVVLKGEYIRVVLPGAPSDTVFGAPLNGLSFQVAWFF